MKRPREDNGHENSDREDSNRQLRPVLAKSPALDSGRSTMTPANRKKPRTDKEVVQAGVYQGGQQSRKCDLCPEETSYTYTSSDIAGAIGHFKKAHLPQVGGDGNVICPWPDCQRSYGGVGTLVRHVREKHLEVRFQCENCGAVLERFNGAHTCIVSDLLAVTSIDLLLIAAVPVDAVLIHCIPTTVDGCEEESKSRQHCCEEQRGKERHGQGKESW